MKLTNDTLKKQVEVLQTKSNAIRQEYQQKINEISEIITSLNEIKDAEETTTVEKNGRRTSKITLVPAKDFDGQPISEQRKQKIFDYCVSKSAKFMDGGGQ